MPGKPRITKLNGKEIQVSSHYTEPVPGAVINHYVNGYYPPPLGSPSNPVPPSRIQQRLAAIPDWNPKEGYHQPGLLPGMSETIQPHYNPPNSLPPNTSDKVFQPFIPGMTPAGYIPVGTPPPGASEQEYNLWNNLKAGFGKGWDYAVESKPWGFARSALWHRAPEEEWVGLNPAARTSYAVGRIAGDALGYGSRSAIWRLHPEDVVGTNAQELIKKAGGDRTAQILTMAGATGALGALSNNVNYFNMGQGLRPSGFGTTNPDADDPRQTDSLPMEYFNRAILGRTGRLLPWEQFHAERPNVDYETYAGYQEYLRDSGILGLAKGTWDGIDGPEARIMGYRVTPLGALAAAGVIGGGVLASKRIAGLRR